MPELRLPQPPPIITEDADTLRIVFPGKRHQGITLFLTVFLLIWIYGGLLAIHTLITQEAVLALRVFLIVWLAVWAGGVWFVGSFWLWLTIGREVVTLTSRDFIIEQQPWPLRKYHRFDPSAIQKLELADHDDPDDVDITLHTREETHQFGGCQVGEMLKVMEKIRERLKIL